MSDPSFRAWHIIAKLLDGDAHLLSADEQATARQLTQRTRFPAQPVKTFFAAPGRRAGKSLIASRIATHAAAQDYRSRLAPGETATIACLATDRKQASILFAYVRACVLNSPLLSAQLVGETSDTLTFAHRTAVEVYASSFRATRGRTFACVLLDEAAFLRSDESAIPDVEIVRAVRPGLATLGGSLIILSSPYMRRGVLYEGHRKHFGNNDSSALYVTGESRAFNPTLDQGVIDLATEEDPEAARSEWMGEFRADLSAALDPAWIERAVDTGVFDRAQTAVLREGRAPLYHAFTDPAGGAGRDSWSTAVVHAEGNDVVQDALLEIRPPFSTAAAAKDTAAILKRYGLSVVSGDKYAGTWPSQALNAEGIGYSESERTKSEIYLETVALFSAGRVRLLDHARTLTQLRMLERRTRAGGKDSVDHPPGGADDNSNALCGALLLAGRTVSAADQQTIATLSESRLSGVDSRWHDPHAEFRDWHNTL